MKATTPNLTAEQPSERSADQLVGRYCPECGSAALWLSCLASAEINAEGELRLPPNAWSINDTDTVTCGDCGCFWRLAADGEFLPPEPDGQERPSAALGHHHAGGRLNA